MIFKTIYKSNENYYNLKDPKDSKNSVNTSSNANQSGNLNHNKYSKTHFVINDDLNLNLSKTNLSKLFYIKKIGLKQLVYVISFLCKR